MLCFYVRNPTIILLGYSNFLVIPVHSTVISKPFQGDGCGLRRCLLALAISHCWCFCKSFSQLLKKSVVFTATSGKGPNAAH